MEKLIVNVFYNQTAARQVPDTAALSASLRALLRRWLLSVRIPDALQPLRA